MLYSKQTPIGELQISRHVVGRIVCDAVDKYSGKVIISNKKGKINAFPNIFNFSDDANNVEVLYGENGLDIKLYIVVRFGVSISGITGKIIKSIYEDIMNTLGEDTNSVSIVVKGTMSKYLTKRHIEVKSYGDKDESD